MKSHRATHSKIQSCVDQLLVNNILNFLARERDEALLIRRKYDAEGGQRKKACRRRLFGLCTEPICGTNNRCENKSTQLRREAGLNKAGIVERATERRLPGKLLSRGARADLHFWHWRNANRPRARIKTRAICVRNFFVSGQLIYHLTSAKTTEHRVRKLRVKKFPLRPTQTKTFASERERVVITILLKLPFMRGLGRRPRAGGRPSSCAQVH